MFESPESMDNHPLPTKHCSWLYDSNLLCERHDFIQKNKESSISVIRYYSFTHELSFQYFILFFKNGNFEYEMFAG